MKSFVLKCLRASVVSVIILLLLVVPAKPSWADGEIRSSTDLSNLIYYPHEGAFEFIADFQSPLNQSSGINSISSKTLNASLIYGLPLKGLRVSLSENDLLSLSSTGGNNVTNEHGFSDPTLQLNYRLTDSFLDVFSSDVGLFYSPSLISRKAANAGFEGNDGKGYSSLGVVATTYFSKGCNEFDISTTITREFSGSVTAADDKNSFARSAIWAGSVSLVDRVHFLTNWYLEAQLSGNFSTSVTENLNSGQVRTILTPSFVRPYIFIGYAPLNWLLLDTFVSYYGYTQHTLRSNNTYASSNFLETLWTLRARVSF